MTGLFGRRTAWGIDLGTANTLISSTTGDIVVNEPSVVTISQRTGAVAAAGVEAYRAVGRNPVTIEAVHPVRSGVVTDLKLAEELLRRFMRRVKFGVLRRRFDAAVAIPCDLTDVERFAVSECARRAGARRVVLVDQVLAAAHGCGVALGEPRGTMVIDAGAGLTEAGVFSLGAVVAAGAVGTAGNAIDQAIAEYIQQRHRLLVGLKTAEAVKQRIGSAIPGAGENRSVQVTGRCLVQGLPKVVCISDGEVREAMTPALEAMVRLARATLDRVPPELSADLIETGAILTGGTALLPGLAERLSAEMQIPVRVDRSPMLSVSIGMSNILGDFRLWRLVGHSPKRCEANGHGY